MMQLQGVGGVMLGRVYFFVLTSLIEERVPMCVYVITKDLWSNKELHGSDR